MVRCAAEGRDAQRIRHHTGPGNHTPMDNLEPALQHLQELEKELDNSLEETLAGFHRRIIRERQRHWINTVLIFSAVVFGLAAASIAIISIKQEPPK